MMAALARLVDRWAINMAAARMPAPDGREAHLAEAQAMIASAEFIPPRVEAAKVQFAGAEGFHFETPWPGPFAENNTVHGRFYRCGQQWQQRPTVILLHGWNDVTDHYFLFPLLARRLNARGFNAATIEAPFHFQRRPRRLGAWSNFLCPDIGRTTQAVRQSIAETRALAEWLRQRGCPKVGLLGVSLGAWLAGLTISRDDRFGCAVLMVPVARLDRVIEEARFCRGIRPAWQGGPVAAGKLNLTEVSPTLPRQNILLIEAIYDLFVAKETMEELWRAWKEPEIWRLRHGHISVLTAPGLHGRIIDWMGPRLRGGDGRETNFD